jgi:hypothetical protein
VARFKCGLNPDRMEPCGSGTRGKDYRRDLQDGSYVFHVGAVDALGNEARIITHHFRIGMSRDEKAFIYILGIMWCFGTVSCDRVSNCVVSYCTYILCWYCMISHGLFICDRVPKWSGIR